MNAVAAHQAVEVVGVIIQDHGPLIPDVPRWLGDKDRINWRQYFNNRAAKEEVYFGKPPPPHGFVCKGDNLNSKNAAIYAYQSQADLALIFGTGMIRDPLFRAMPTLKVNMHLGLSPRYRGAATLFWPFYFLEPNQAGVTFHQIVAEPDAGAILHQSRPELKHRDTIHDVGCRAVVHATEDMLELLTKWPEWEFKTQKNTGKAFMASDFQPHHLRTIYDTWGDKIVDAYLRGDIRPTEPKLYRGNL